MSTSSNSNSMFQCENPSPLNHSVLFIRVTQLVTSDTSSGKCPSSSIDTITNQCQYKTYCNPPSLESTLIEQDCSDLFSFWGFKTCCTNVWTFAEEIRFSCIKKIFPKTLTSCVFRQPLRLIQMNLIWTLRLAWHNVKIRSFWQTLELTWIGKYDEYQTRSLKWLGTLVCNVTQLSFGIGYLSDRVSDVGEINDDGLGKRLSKNTKRSISIFPTFFSCSWIFILKKNFNYKEKSALVFSLFQ